MKFSELVNFQNHLNAMSAQPSRAATDLELDQIAYLNNIDAQDKKTITSKKKGSITAANFSGKEIQYIGNNLATGAVVDKNKLLIYHAGLKKYFNIDPVMDTTTLDLKIKYNNIWKISNTNGSELLYVKVKKTDNTFLKITDTIKIPDQVTQEIPPPMPMAGGKKNITRKYPKIR